MGHSPPSNRKACREAAAEHAVPAGRCAREIVGILAVFVVRLRRLNGNPLGGWGSVVNNRFSS
jgi:hypothetical protein